MSNFVKKSVLLTMFAAPFLMAGGYMCSFKKQPPERFHDSYPDANHDGFLSHHEWETARYSLDGNYSSANRAPTAEEVTAATYHQSNPRINAMEICMSTSFDDRTNIVYNFDQNLAMIRVSKGFDINDDGKMHYGDPFNVQAVYDTLGPKDSLDPADQQLIAKMTQIRDRAQIRQDSLFAKDPKKLSIL